MKYVLGKFLKIEWNRWNEFSSTERYHKKKRETEKWQYDGSLSKYQFFLFWSFLNKLLNLKIFTQSDSIQQVL